MYRYINMDEHFIMAGIFGFLLKTEKYDALHLKNTLINQAKFNFQHQTDFYADNSGKAGLGYALPFPRLSKPLISKDRNYVFQHFGEIYLPDKSIITESNFEEQFLLPYLKHGSNYIIQLNGAFIFSIFIKNENKFVICNDPFGNFALHYYNDKDLFIFSSQIQAIRKIISSISFDHQGFGEYLGLGFTLNGRTYYSNIKRLQPAEVLEISCEDIQKTNYYIPQYKYASDVKNNIPRI